MKFTKIAAAVLLSISAISAQADILNVESLTVTSGAFNMGDTNLGIAGCVVGGFGSHQCFTAGGSIGDGVLGDGVIDADGVVGTATSLTLASFTFFGAPVFNYFASSAAGAANDPDPGAISAVVDTVAGTITADFSGFYANWSGTNFLQGGTATGTVMQTGVDTYSYSMSWSSLITTAPFAGQTGNWNLVGTLTTAPVPEASTYGMMLAGLGLVGFAVRRRKLMA